ncbi:serine hydrolase domain-containing protein [Anaeromicropila populeti]|uniref:Beta-lactamase class C n=1 Tax=Anaeromicropila populeti TaxID=37658 RepID=A0A1I6KHL7_9FIRM|nr:serine hydrolase domain-containing protein [Anaeromicropila populeti]SFR90360.1 beta-lactamase class C [Anaeromicropila populeti]
MIELLEKLNLHTEGMTNIKLSMGIIEGNKVEKYFFDGKNLKREIPNYIYEIGSVTKTFTTGLLCKAINEKKVQLNDCLSKYLGDIVVGKKYPSLLQLATHTSGYTNDFNARTDEISKKIEEELMSVWSGNNERDNLYQYIGENYLLEHIAATNLEEKPYEFLYSNIGMAVLGYALGRAYDKSYEELLMDFIKNDLGLYSTYIDRPLNGYISGYNANNESCGNWLWENSAMKPAGSMYSNLDDMVKYIQIYLSSSIPYLSETHNKSYAISVDNCFEVGLGWIKNGEVTWHNGGTGCFRSFVGFREDKEFGVVLLENYHEKNKITIDTIGMDILNMVLE